MTVDVLAEAARVAAPSALATVIATAGSSPRHAAAKMIVAASGEQLGTVGGGRIELEVVERARAVAAGAPAERVDKHLGHDLAMCCGGRMSVWIEPLDRSRLVALAEAARRRGRRTPVALVTALASPGGKDLLERDDTLRTRRPRLEGDRFIEPILPTERLVLFGGGHVARALAPLAASVGFEIVVCDEDERFADEERFPGARLVGTFDVAEAARELDPFGPDDYVIITTRDHGIDERVLERLLPRVDLTYLGLIGSRGKLGRFRKRLEARGLADPEPWARLHSPVGLEIGAETPEEIAVSVVAEMVRARHARVS
jgi:xanthine dehydrogenase accessory factor